MKKIKNTAKTIASFAMYPISKQKFKKIRILSSQDTIDLIVKNQLSVVRYGDGEFKWMLGIKNESFQKNDKELEKRLLEVFHDNDKKILKCIPLALKDNSKNTRGSKFFWRKFTILYSKKLKTHFSTQYTYGNASFTRPYIANKEKKEAQQLFQKIRKIWDKRDVLIVEGKGTKFGIGNDLLNNAATIKRILCPETDAYSKYNEIFSKTQEYGKNKLVLAALGPTATILAHDLQKNNIQCIDIGHIDLEYEWFMRGAQEKILIPGKSTNEVSRVNIVSNNTQYEIPEEEIIHIIK